jgi:uncharacterized protein (TIGR02466 family)
MQTAELFPKVVGVFDLERNLTKKELTLINQNLCVLEENDNNKISVNKSVLNDANLCDLKQFINDALKQYVEQVLDETTELQITQSWLNKTAEGESHHQHCHQNSYLSGVFYVRTNEDDKIIFYNSDPRNNYFKPTVNNWNLVNAQSWWLPTKQNSLLVFRSDLYHSVPKTSNKERISLSFNTFPIGSLGNEQSATYLPLPN